MTATALEEDRKASREAGNLRRIHDTGRVATLEDFRRRHFLYQVTPAGEAAERAVGAVLEVLRASGSLQTVMLGAIAKNLGDLRTEMQRPAPRPEALYEALFNVTQQFRALTENASIFLARLHEAIDASDVRRQAFLRYKEAVIAYLDDFLRELSEIVLCASTPPPAYWSSKKRIMPAYWLSGSFMLSISSRLRSRISRGTPAASAVCRATL